LLKKRELTTLKRPPRTQMAPPPSYSPSLFASVDEGQVLDGEARVILVVAVGVVQTCASIAGVHVEDAVVARPAQRDQAPAVDDDFRAGVVEDPSQVDRG
jgi:hypothetical protein